MALYILGALTIAAVIAVSYLGHTKRLSPGVRTFAIWMGVMGLAVLLIEQLRGSSLPWGALVGMWLFIGPLTYFGFLGRLSRGDSYPGHARRFVRPLNLLALSAMVVGAFVIVYSLDRVGGRRSAEAPVRVLEERRRLDGGYTVRFAYTVGGREHLAIASESKSYDPGDAVKACYNPDDPGDVGLVRVERVCGDTLLFR